MKCRTARRTLQTLKLMLVIFAFIIISIVGFGNRLHILTLFRKMEVRNNILLIDTPGCKIPRTEPWDQSVKRYLHSGSELQCRVKEDVVISRGNKIIINKAAVRRLMPYFSNCNYKVIWRPPNQNTHNNFFVLKNESKEFTDSEEITDEFIRVQCYDKKKRTVYINAFSFVHFKPEVEKRCKDNFKNLNDNLTHLSVLMVGVDSVSRSNMIRYMPKTREYLLKNMSALEFLAYNKVADNTFLNIVPMTTGKYVHELPWNASMVNTTFDRFDFLWNEYARKGYRTLYSEDSPYGQIFDYQKAGFSKPSADYFDRPLFLVLEELQHGWNTNHHCLHARPETSIVLSYSQHFVTKFKSLPYFNFAFITRLTHDEISNTRKADKLYFEFLSRINKDNILNNTIFMFYSDHGIRFGDFRQTFVGKIEERLPFLFFVFPKWFKTSYSHIYKNLLINTKRLVTPFDIYETLKNILHFPNYEINSNRSYSIFNEIPLDRTCKDADILPQWCTCSQQTILSTDDPTVINVTNLFVNKLNEKLFSYSQCEMLKLKRIISATKMKPSDVLLKYIKTEHSKIDSKIQFGEKVKTFIDYQITIETSPGGARFEGTIRKDEHKNHPSILGDLSRINMYGKTSHCVKGIELKKICYCKKQLTG